MISRKDTLAALKEIVRDVGAMQRRNLGRADLQVDKKSSGIDLVTEIDTKSEEQIMGFLRERFPDYGFLAEESGLSAGNPEYVWVIDPLDGTTNYAQGLPIFAVSIALQYRGSSLLGVVYEPVTDELFAAAEGQGAWLNGERIQVSGKSDLLESVLATGFPYDIASNPLNNLDYFSYMAPRVRAIRRMGAAAYDLASVGAGRFDGFWEMSLAPWDVAAAELIVREAGGVIVPFRQDRRISIIAGNAVLCAKIGEVLREVDRQRQEVCDGI